MLHCLDAAEQARLEALRLTDPAVEAGLRQLGRMLTSPHFTRLHQQAKDFLVWIVAKALLGESDQIKEPTIAVFVYNEPANFNSAATSRIRVAATNLRRRAAAYNQTEGRKDPTRISLPSVGYVPQIQDRRVSILVSPLDNWNSSGDQGYVGTGLRLEIIRLLNQAGWVQASPTAGEPGSAGAIYGLRGSLEICADVLRLNISLGQLARDRIVASRNVEERRDHVFRLARRVADLLVRVLEAEVDGQAFRMLKASTRRAARSSKRAG